MTFFILGFVLDFSTFCLVFHPKQDDRPTELGSATITIPRLGFYSFHIVNNTDMLTLVTAMQQRKTNESRNLIKDHVELHMAPWHVDRLQCVVNGMGNILFWRTVRGQHLVFVQSNADGLESAQEERYMSAGLSKNIQSFHTWEWPQDGH